MILKKRIGRILRRLFHRKQRQSMSRRQRIGLEGFHHALHRDMAQRELGLIVDGKFYEAAVEKFTEIMMERVKLGEAPLTEASFVPDIPVVRVSNLPELLLLLGVRIKG